YLWDAGELKPRDSARLKLLLAPTTLVDWNWRGDDEVDVTGYGRESAQTVERELRTVIVWISLYILFGSLWPAPGSEDTELGVLMEPEVGHGETKVYPRVQG